MNVGGVDKHPLTQPSPPRGRGLIGSSPLPVGEGWVRASFSIFRVPREGGDPDLFTPAEKEGAILVLRQAQDEDECWGRG